MKKLIITAHPSSQGFTQRIAKTFAESAQSAGHSVEVINLYDPQWHQDFLKFETVKEWPVDPVREKIQEKILWADELVFVCPVWWGYVPAVMKNFFDCNFTSGFAFKFQKGKTMPDKLLRGRTAQIFMTCDGPKIFYYLLLFPFRTILKYITLEFCGIKLKRFFLFDQMHKKSESQKAKILDKVCKYVDA